MPGRVKDLEAGLVKDEKSKQRNLNSRERRKINSLLCSSPSFFGKCSSVFVEFSLQ